MNLELAEQIVALIGDYPVSEITVEQEGRRVSVRRPLLPVVPEAAVMADEVLALEGPPEALSVAAPTAVEEVRLLASPMVGIFRHAAPPLPYAALVQPGQVIGSIESMKLINDVVAEAGGRVTDILVEDGAPVDYGQPLFRLVAR